MPAGAPARALIGLGPAAGSAAHRGTSPHLGNANPRRVPSAFGPTTATTCPGATLYRGFRGGTGPATPNAAAPRPAPAEAPDLLAPWLA